MFFAQGEQVDELCTERLRLRVPRRGDLGELDLAIQETLDELQRWLPWARPGHTRADSRRYLGSVRAARHRRAGYEFAITDLASQAMLGMVSLHRIDWIRRSAGIGYWVRRSAWGKGIATEAATAVLELGLRHCGLNRVEVHVALGNQASQRVAEKLGLEREGIARGIEFVNGEYLDHVQFAMLRSDLEDRRP